MVENTRVAGEKPGGGHFKDGGKNKTLGKCENLKVAISKMVEKIRPW